MCVSVECYLLSCDAPLADTATWRSRSRGAEKTRYADEGTCNHLDQVRAAVQHTGETDAATCWGEIHSDEHTGRLSFYLILGRVCNSLLARTVSRVFDALHGVACYALSSASTCL